MSTIRPSFGTDNPMEIILLASYGSEIFGIDRDTRSFVRFEIDSAKFSDQTYNPFAVWRVKLSSRPAPSDPSRPELIEVTEATAVSQIHKKRSIIRLARECASPTSIPILGFNGPSISYSLITGRSPSVTIIELTKRQAIRKNSYGEITISFPWGQVIASLPIGNELERAAFEKADRVLNSDREIASVIGFRPKYIVAGLARPRAGYCRKMAMGLLPEKISRRTAKILRAAQLAPVPTQPNEYGGTTLISDIDEEPS